MLIDRSSAACQCEPDGDETRYSRECDYCGTPSLRTRCEHDAHQDPCPECDVSPVPQPPGPRPGEAVIGGPVRPATADDAAELVRLRHAMFFAMVAAGAAGRPDDVGDVAWHPAAHRALVDGLDRGVLAAFVVDAPAAVGRSGLRERPLVACAVATVEERLPGPGSPTGRAGSMSSVFVEPAHRGQGLARAVVAAAVDWLDAQGAEVVDLHATAAAERLYRSLGFTDPRSVALRRWPDDVAPA